MAALVVLCFVLFSLYFREGDTGPLHSVQNVAGSIVAPVEGVTTKAVQPVRDLWGWANDISDARDRASRYEQELRNLKSDIAEGQFRSDDTARINALAGVGDQWRSDYAQVPASIISSTRSPWIVRARLDVGTADGVVRNSPVVAKGDLNAGLAGIVTQAASHTCIVTFITEQNTGIGVTIDKADGAIGLLQPSIPGQLKVTGIRRQAPVENGQIVYTRGASEPLTMPSYYPRGIPVGLVADVGSRDVDVEQTIQVTPFVNVEKLAYVVVLAPTSDRAKRRAQG